MRSIYKKILVLLVFIFVQSSFANEQIEVKEHFLNKIDSVISIVDDKKLSKVERNSNIIKVLTPIMDFELMAKLSLANKWKDLSNGDKDKFIALYVERMKNSYSSKIDAYKDEKVEVKEIKQTQEGRIALVTDLVSKGQKLEIVYKFHKPKDKIANKENWLIYDVEILGVSILKTDIAQFKEFLQTKSIAQLIEALSRES